MVREYNTGELPTLVVRLYEGTATVADKFDQTGMVVEDTVSFSAPVAKGDYVTLYASDSTATLAANRNRVNTSNSRGQC